MKINEVEALVGIPKKNIRFYESEGLLKPERSSNGYRDYSEEEAEILRRIKLLRKLGVPLEEISRAFALRNDSPEGTIHVVIDCERQNGRKA